MIGHDCGVVWTGVSWDLVKSFQLKFGGSFIRRGAFKGGYWKCEELWKHILFFIS